MKRIIAVLLCFTVLLSLSACGSPEKPAGNTPPSVQQPAPSPGNTTKPPADNPVAKAVCVSNDAFREFRDAFDEYALEFTENHEIVSVTIGMVTAFELGIFNYLLPLSFLGRSIESMGKFDKSLEETMLKTGWAKDASITDNGDGSYRLTGTDEKDNKLRLEIKFDAAADSLRLEGQSCTLLSGQTTYSASMLCIPASLMRAY